MAKIDVYLREYATRNDDTLLTREEAANYLKIDSSTLWHWSKKGKLIPYRIGNRVYYKKQEITDYLDSHHF